MRLASTGGASLKAMKRQKWYPKRPYTPRRSTLAGTRHWEIRCTPHRAPMISAQPISRNGGIRDNCTLRNASMLQRSMAHNAWTIAFDFTAQYCTGPGLMSNSPGDPYTHAAPEGAPDAAHRAYERRLRPGNEAARPGRADAQGRQFGCGRRPRSALCGERGRIPQPGCPAAAASPDSDFRRVSPSHPLLDHLLPCAEQGNRLEVHPGVLLHCR